MEICIHCGNSFKPNPRVKGQRYCREKACQRARRARWQRKKMAADPDYRDNQSRCRKGWMANHPGYYREYRDSHPEYVKRNRLLQAGRDARRHKDRIGRFLAKMDSLAKGFYSRRGGLFKLIPEDDRLLAKMDSLVVRLVGIGAVDR